MATPSCALPGRRNSPAPRSSTASCRSSRSRSPASRCWRPSSALHAPHRRDDCGRRIAAAPSRPARSAVRPSQPHLLRRAAGSGDRGSPRRQRAGGRVLHRPRPLQGRQRHARPSGRRRADPQRDPAAVAHAARRRSRGAAWRRRIRRDLLDRGRQRRDADARPAHHLGNLRALRHQRPEHRHRRLDRHRDHRPELRDRGRHHALRRHGAVPRQERRPQPRLHLRRGDGCRSVQRKLLEADLREAIDNDRLQLAYQPVVNASGETVIGVEALAAGRIRPAATSRRPSSSRSPSIPA